MRLEAVVEHPEERAVSRRLAEEPERLVWLVDGQELAHGTVTSVDRLEPGRHEVTVVYRGEEQEAEHTVGIEVREPAGPTADDWPEWEGSGWQ